MKIRKYITTILVIILALAIVVGIILFVSEIKPNFSINQNTVSFATPSELNITIPTEETTAETTEAPTETTTEETTTEPRRYVESSDDSQIYFTNYRFTTVEPDYFDDAIFIGNSRMQGFILYSKLPELRTYNYIGLSVLSYFSKSAFTINGVDMTTAQAMENETNFNKVYIKLGINEVGWLSTEQFIEAYSEIIEHIYSCNPNAMIFVMSVLPISDHALEIDPGLTHERVFEYNEAIKDMAAKYGACYLDVFSAFADENGKLPDSMAFDGIHLTPDGVQLWLQYLLEHGIEEN